MARKDVVNPGRQYRKALDTLLAVLKVNLETGRIHPDVAEVIANQLVRLHEAVSSQIAAIDRAFEEAGRLIRKEK